MTENFKDMLYLLGANYKSTIPYEQHEYNIEEIKRMSISQGVWTLVYPELEKYADLSEGSNVFLKAVAQGIQKNTFQLQTLAELKEKGFNYCLLKGAAIASLYPNPEYRISSDTDILIKPEDEKDIIDFLKQKGYTVQHREKNDHHFKAYHPVGGLLEGHVRLYSIPTEQMLLNGINLYGEEFSEIEIEGYTVPVLGLNDGLMYLTAHYIKHLVNEGGGVRQMLDLLIYMEHYKDKLDFDRYYKLLKQLKYDKLIDVIKTIGAKYWGFDYPVKYEELANEILTDSEEGGIFGYDTDSRKGFYSEYCRRRESNTLKYQYLTMIKSERTIWNRLFPGQEKLITLGYEYAKNKVLIPFAWCHYMVIAVRNRIKKKTTTEEGNASGARLRMMEQLGMINKYGTGQ